MTTKYKPLTKPPRRSSLTKVNEVKIKKGSYVVVEQKAPWNGPGFEGTQWHRRVVIGVVTEVSAHWAEYKDVKILEETGCPPAPLGKPGVLDCGGFSLPAMRGVRSPTKAELKGV